MMEWLWWLSQLPVTAQATPPAVTETVECEPSYEHTSWEFVREDRKYEGTWVVAYHRYTRVQTEVCSGDTETQRKTEGPFKLYPATPDERVAAVNAPEWQDTPLTGSPLRSTDFPTGLAPQTGPSGMETGEGNKAPGETPSAPSPFNPFVLTLIGAVVAAAVGRRWWPKQNLDLGSTDDELLEAKGEQYRSLARSGKYDVSYPQFQADPAFEGALALKENASPAAMKQIEAWQGEWERVRGYWDEFFQGQRTGDPPTDPWGVKEIAVNQAKERFGAEAQEFLALLIDLVLHLDEFDTRIGAIQASWDKLEHWKSVLDPNEADALLGEVLGSESELMAILLVEMKRRQIEELRQNGEFKTEDPQFKDTQFEAFAPLWNVVDQNTQEQVKGLTRKWKRWLEERKALDNMGDAWYPGRPAVRDAGDTSSGISSAATSSFWDSIGPAPVIVNDGRKEFSPTFSGWATAYNEMVQRHWRGKTTDAAGTPTDRLVATYQLTPEKVEKLWDAARRNNVDPRLLLAILVQEGTGSFDTNSENAGKYLRGNGPQPDWDKDLQAAFDGLILAKLRLYPAAVQGGFEGDWVDYVNWYTPIDRVSGDNGAVGASGVYAEDIFWGDGVRRIYTDIVKELDPSFVGDPVMVFSAWMTANASLFKPKYVSGDFQIQPGSPGSVEAAVHKHHYDPAKYPNAYHRKDENGQVVTSWYYFPAPEWYVWTLVPGKADSASSVPDSVPLVQYQVPLLKQGDPEWEETPMAPSSVKASKPTTIENYGCAVTSAAMALQYLGVQTDPNDIVARASANDAAAATKDEPNEKLGLLSVWELSWYKLAQEFPDVTAKAADYTDLKQLREWLGQGPVILGGTGKNGPHFVILTGFTGEGTSLSDFLINDPGADRKTLADFQETYPEFKWVRQFTK